MNTTSSREPSHASADTDPYGLRHPQAVPQMPAPATAAVVTSSDSTSISITIFLVYVPSSLATTC